MSTETIGTEQFVCTCHRCAHPWLSLPAACVAARACY